jgi:hypothetical protein
LVGLLFFIEGLCFGGIDAFSALAISEMWGQRAQPWMQTKNLFSNFGSLLGPALVNAYGYKMAFLMIGFLGCVSVLGFVFDEINNQSRKCLALPELDHNLISVELSMMTSAMEAMEDGEEGSAIDGKEDWEDLVYQVLDEVHYEQSNGSSSPQKKTSPRSKETNFDFPSPRKRLNSLTHPHIPDASGLESSPTELNATLAFASPQLARHVRNQRIPVGIYLVPVRVRVLLAVMVFWELGLLCSYGGWIGTYVGTFDHRFGGFVGGDDVLHTTSEAAGAQVLSVFYAAQIVGSILSVPASVVFSTTCMMRCQLSLSVLAGALMYIPLGMLAANGWLMWVTSLSAGLMGLSLGCMYPLIMTVANDYGATM